MRDTSPAAAAFRRLASTIGLFCLYAVVGCGPSTPEGRAGFSIEPSPGWTKATQPVGVVPGSIIASWSGPEGATLVAFSSLPIPAPNPEALGKELATRWLNLPGVNIEGQSVATYSGLKAARVEAVGPGTGGSFVPSGIGKPVPVEGKPLIPTRMVYVSFPRGSDTLTLVWHFPESARAAIEPQVESALHSVHVVDSPQSASSY